MKQRFQPLNLPRFRPGDALTAERLNMLAAAAEALGARRVLSRRAAESVAVPDSAARKPAPFTVTLPDPKDPDVVSVSEGTVFGDGAYFSRYIAFPDVPKLEFDGNSAGRRVVALRFHKIFVDIGDVDYTYVKGLQLLNPSMPNPVELVYSDVDTLEEWRFGIADMEESESEIIDDTRNYDIIAEIGKAEQSSGGQHWEVKEVRIRNDVFFGFYPTILAP